MYGLAGHAVPPFTADRRDGGPEGIIDGQSSGFSSAERTGTSVDLLAAQFAASRLKSHPEIMSAQLTPVGSCLLASSAMKATRATSALPPGAGLPM